MTVAGVLSGCVAVATGEASGSGAACALAGAVADVALLVCAIGDAVRGGRRCRLARAPRRQGLGRRGAGRLGLERCVGLRTSPTSCR